MNATPPATPRPASFHAPAPARWSRLPRRLRAIVVVGSLLPWIAGCDSLTYPKDGPRSAPPGPTINRPSAFDRIAKGMSADEVLALVGKPRSNKAYSIETAQGETWRYERKIDETVRQVPISSREVPRFNPFTLQTEMIPEPVMGEEYTVLFEDIELLLVDDHVVAISRWPRVEKHINN
jgi:hypothetical protein